MVRERVEIVVVENGVRRVIRNIGLIGVAAAAATNPVGQLQTALRVLGLTVGIRGLLRTADAFTTLQNRVRLVTDTTEQLNSVTRELVDLSNRTRTSVEGSATFFNRLSFSVKQLGVSQEELLRITESVNQAIIISGATTKEAENGLIQLSQGLASGALRGDELRSILEQLPPIADVIATQMGVTRGELRALGAEFLITSDVIIKGFQNARDELSKRFAKTIPTIGQALTVLSNSFTAFFGQLDTGIGVTRTLAQSLVQLALNLDRVAKAVGVLTVAFVALKITRVTEGFLLGTQGVIQYYRAVRSGNAVILGSAEALRQQAAAQLAVVAARQADAIQAANQARVVLDAAVATGRTPDRRRFASVTKSQAALVAATKVATKETEALAVATAKYNAAAVAAAGGTSRFSTAMAALGVRFGAITNFFKRSPFALFAGGLTAVIGLLTIFNNDLRLGQDELVDIGDVAGVAGRRIRDAFDVVTSPVIKSFGPVMLGIQLALRRTAEVARTNNLFSAFAESKTTFEGTIRFFARTLDNFLALVRGLGTAVVDTFKFIFDTVAGIGASLVRVIEAIARSLKSAFTGDIDLARDSLSQALNNLDLAKIQFADSGRGLGEALTDGFARGVNETRAAAPAETLLDSFIRSAEQKIAIEAAAAANRAKFAGPPELDQEQKGFVDILTKQLAEEGRLVGLVNREMQIQRDLLEIVNELKTKGVAIDQHPALRARIESQLRLNASIAEMQAVLNDVHSQEEEFARQLVILNQLIPKNAKETDKLVRKRRELQIASLELNVDLKSGLDRGLLKVEERLQDVASTGEDLVVNAFQSAEDAMVRFARTGEASFRELVDSILDDLARLASQKLLNELLDLGAGFFSSGSSTVPASESFANSTTASFTPPAGASGFFGGLPGGGSTSNILGGNIASPAQPVNIKIVNVLTPNDLADAMTGEAGERVVLHHIGRNPKGVRKRIGG